LHHKSKHLQNHLGASQFVSGLFQQECPNGHHGSGDLNVTKQARRSFRKLHDLGWMMWLLLLKHQFYQTEKLLLLRKKKRRIAAGAQKTPKIDKMGEADGYGFLGTKRRCP
jgi:hypothetical protein